MLFKQFISNCYDLKSSTLMIKINFKIKKNEKLQISYCQQFYRVLQLHANYLQLLMTISQFSVAALEPDPCYSCTPFENLHFLRLRCILHYSLRYPNAQERLKDFLTVLLLLLSGIKLEGGREGGSAHFEPRLNYIESSYIIFCSIIC